ncbi:recombinase family protein [Streptomyces sp. NPDC048623]|uniref:recombinase family protein n=1 Tax=Streptomyces sp. NPDC048623 TaxID=3155761 RepID=UPI003431B94E
MGARVLPRKQIGKQVIRIAIYLRVSTAQQLEGYGLKVQEDQCRAWIAYAMRGLNHVIVDVYIDGGVSGKLASRDELDRMTADAMAGRLDMIVFGKLDRIGRTMKNIHRWVYDVTDKGVRVATADGRIDSDDDMFGIQLSLLAYMAEVEHALILERTMGGRMQKVAVGGWPLGEPPFGIMLDNDGNPVLNPAEVKQFEDAAKIFIDAPEIPSREDGARSMNALNHRSRQGKEWTGGNLAGRLRAGLKGYVDFTFAGTNEDGEPIETSYRVEIPKPLPDDRAAELLAILDAGSRPKSRPASKYLLSNRLFSLCGTHRTGATTPGTDDRYYRCMGTREGVQDHDCWELPADEVDAAVWGEVKSLMADKDKLHALIEGWLGTVPERASSYRRRLVELDTEVEKKKASRRRKIALLLASVDDDEDGDDATLVEELRAELNAKIDELIEERDRVSDWLTEAEAQEGRAAHLMSLVEKVDGNMDDFTLDQKQDVLDLLRVEVQITDKGRPRHKGLVDPITEWHRETGTPIPATVTDEMWAKVRDILSSNRQWKDVRGGFEVMLDKLRTGRAWNSYSGDERIGGRTYATLYRRVHAWFGSGEYEKALEALSPFLGVPVPPLYVLPSMHVTGAVDDSVTSRAAGERKHSVSCNESETAEASSRR